MDEKQISHLVEQVQENRKYQAITPEIIQRLAKDALHRGLHGKPAVKDVRNKLHQIGGAYFRKTPDYQTLQNTLLGLPHDQDAEEIQQFCREAMQAHASTAERLPILEEFFSTCLAPVAPLTSVIDLACGLNPFAVPWMPLSKNCTYLACDIYLDMLSLVEVFFTHINLAGNVMLCDLAAGAPVKRAQVTFLLKSIPCLEQVDKAIANRLLQSIQTDHILVSFPVRSLRGQQKGMADFYREHFYEILSGTAWQVREFKFSTELAFLVTK
jgi:16S rRNA (guanine(1405)-N(7))-methyltransferase